MSTNDITHVSTVHDTVAILSQTREILNDDIFTLDNYTHSHNQSQRMTQNRDMDQIALSADQTPGLTEQQTLQAHRLQEVEMHHINNTSAQPGTNNILGINSTYNSNSDTPSWLTSVLQEFDKKWSKIETHLQKQDHRWQNVASQLEHQSSRMNNMEQQMNQLSELRTCVSDTQNQLTKQSTHLSDLSAKMNEYDRSINHYSDICDDIVRTSADSDSKINYLLKRVETLELNQAQMQSQTAVYEEKVVDLQCRSMRQNLIFTGISEPELPVGEYEDVNYTLRRFLREEMHFDRDRNIEIERVHRLGRPRYNQRYPRPIIAKFLRYQDKEDIRLAAPKRLYRTHYGVREQFPPEIEEKRKDLYPIAKEFRQNRNNVVRLVRDKLYVNGKEVVAEHRDKSLGFNENRYRRPDRQPTSNAQHRVQWRYATKEGTSSNRRIQSTRSSIHSDFQQQDNSSRVNIEGPKHSDQRQKNRQSVSFKDNSKKEYVPWQLPIRNSFNPLSGIDSDSGLNATPYITSGKKKTVSPIDSEYSAKKRRGNQYKHARSETPMDIQQIDESSDNDPNTDSQHDLRDPPSKSLIGYEKLSHAESNEESNKISTTSRYDPHSGYSEAPQKSMGAYEDAREPEASRSLSDTQTATSVSGIFFFSR